MSTYHSILQILAIIFVLLFILSFIRLLVSIGRSKRIESFAITRTNDNMTFELRLYNLVYKLSEFISDLVVFNAVSIPYEKYVSMADNKFRRGMDFIALKTIFGFIGMFLYLIWDFMYHVHVTSLTLVISFVIGSVIPDIYYRLKYHRYNAYIVDDLLRTVIIINNSFRANRSIEQALNDVITRLDGPLKKEFLKVKSDLRLGIDLSDSFRRMYNRTKISTIYDIANKMALIGEQGVNVVKVFENIEKDILEEEKLRNDVKSLNNFNSLLYYSLLILPFIVMGWVVFTNNYYFSLVFSDAAFIYIILFVVIYVIYAIVLRRVAKVIYYER